MTSRRPMLRTYSGNGRTSSFSEDESNSSNGRSESRNAYLSNVRPENRSTLCSIMAQLTEDIQPSFETTLKSKAVSENCNVKFTCVVSGYPAPELKWYKDDMEMDRYCGLPKYEIRRNGKTHTLHIYNCTLDDAAIYQVSASNSKGIVSCSGVLEVGTMNEYKIHQRFFAKLKEKAEKKKNEMEVQTKKEEKENIQKEKPKSSPERPPRKRHASFVKEDSCQQQVPDCVVVSPQPNNQAARGASSKEDRPVLIPTQVTCEDKSSQTLTPTSMEESLTLPQSVISLSESHSLGDVPTETLQEEEMAVDVMRKEDEPCTEEEHSAITFCEEEKAEVKSIEKPPSDIDSYEITKLAFSFEERIESCEPKTPDQVLESLSTVAALTEGDNVKEETKHSSLIPKINFEFLPIANSDNLERCDLKIQEEECISSKLEERPEAENVSAIQSPNSDFRCSKDESELADVFVKELEVISCNNQKPQEVAILEGENTEPKKDNLRVEEEKEKNDSIKVEEFYGSKKLSATQNKEGNAVVLEERGNVAQQDSSVVQQGWPLENIPEIQISTVEDIPEIKPAIPEVNPNDQFIIPKIEIFEPEIKEFTLPLTILALNNQESESVNLQEHDATHVSAIIIQDQSMVNSPSVHPSQEGMQDDCSLSLTQKVKEVVQSEEKTEMLEHEQPQVKISKQFPQMDFASIPLISVSCSDHKEDDVYVNTHISDMRQVTETPPAPLFVVPPISVTSLHHVIEGALRLSTGRDSVETETSAAMQRGTKYDVANNMGITRDKPQSQKQNLDETADRSMKKNAPCMLYEALLPKVGDNGPLFSKTTEDSIFPDILQKKTFKEAKIENFVSVEDLQRNRSSVERLFSKPPTHPSLSPASLRKLSKVAPESDCEAVAITMSGRQNDKADEDLSGGSTPTSSLSCESSPRLKRRDSLSLIRSATPEELASGARRKIFIPKPKEDGEMVGVLDCQGKKESPYMSPGQARRAALLQSPTGQNTPPMERRSPLVSRRKITLAVPRVTEDTSTEEPVSPKREEKPVEKKLDPLKAPQVIRKIRGEPFPDASGHLKLWCQFFNVLIDSTIKWYRDEEEILELKRSGGDESQVALAIVLASSQDCGVYGCSISNEYGTDTTDFLLSVDILSEILLKDDLEVGEEIEMTPLLFTKGLADSGSWGDKYFGRIMTETVHVGEGSAHKASRVRVIYGLDPIFESGSACIIKVQNPIAYGTKQESNLVERNGEITKQECKVQNVIREYCKIFAAEARVIENFGYSVIPQYLMYRPANSVPYATVEADLKGVVLKYCMMDPKGRLIMQTGSEVQLKCGTFQHWLHQWTHGNLLVTQMDGRTLKRVCISTRLTENGSPEIFEQFLTHHQCNYYCGLLGLKPLKNVESLQQSTKMKGSRSPLLNRKLGSTSPQLQRKGQSPQMLRKSNKLRYDTPCEITLQCKMNESKIQSARKYLT
uniref:non-specific serine/threonine protein kinase n=1 Tax=Mola mola TaxID=94237 RepID=A0A3Q3W483_MOLML